MKKPFNIFLTLLLMLLGWRVLSLGLADHYAHGNPERALFWHSSHPEALLQMARKHAMQRNWPEAKRFAKQALKSRPVDGRPLVVLAQAAAAEENNIQALALYRKASKMAPRDVAARIWLLQNALLRRDAKDVAEQLDALLQLQPGLMGQIQAQADLLAVTPEARGALLATLADAPPWRGAFLAGLAKATYPIDAIAPFFAALTHTPDTPLAEINPWLARLRAENRTLQAYVTWVNRIPAVQHRSLGNVFDGGFEIPQEDQPGIFAWQTPALPGANAYWSANPGTVGESSYVVEFEGRRTPFAHLQQVLVIPAGDWQLRWRAKGERLDSPRGLVWQLRCDFTGQLLAESAPMRGQFEWREQILDFTVPPDCQGQQLSLRIPARIPAETLIDGTLWLDAVTISPAPRNSLVPG